MKKPNRSIKINFPKIFSNYTPNLEAANLLETFLISAVVSLLCIRSFLEIMNFPQFGGGNFHIAHLLWGGFFMLGSIILMLVFINSQARQLASVLGGIGFGSFIDELGKYITNDNNYFYQPTVALIYIIFVSIYLLIRFLSTITVYPSKTYLINAIEHLKEVITSDLSAQERTKALFYLKEARKENKIGELLFKLISEANYKSKNVSPWVKISRGTFQYYRKTITRKFFAKGIILYFILISIFNFFMTLLLFAESSQLTISMVGYFLSSVVVSLFVVLGCLYYVKRSLLLSYSYFQRATLVSIFLTQFFLFLFNELSAIITFGMYVSAYLILKSKIESIQNASS